MTYAIIRFGGKQLKIKQGDSFDIEHQDDDKADVLLFSDGSNTVIGEPICTGYEVILSKISDFRGKKVRIARFKAKSRYNKVNTHRQPYSLFKVDYIGKKGGFDPKALQAVKEVKKEPVSATKEVKKIKLPKILKKQEKEVKKVKEETVKKKRGRPKKESK